MLSYNENVFVCTWRALLTEVLPTVHCVQFADFIRARCIFFDVFICKLPFIR